MKISAPFRRFIYGLICWYWRAFKPVVLGSRALVIRDGKVLLVRLSYTDGWYLPGGGVARGESFHAAALRELREECALAARDARFFGLYFSRKQGKTDHVAVFVVTDFDKIEGVSPDAEIKEIAFFPLEALPNDATPATRRRVREYLSGAATTDQW
jgi:ADP-ribose pyrophosphatase YjhB (NUDIX family)